MSAYWNRSRAQEVDSDGEVLAGSKAYFYEAGTSTPMDVFSASGLGQANEHPFPVVADGEGRWPQVFFDDSLFSFYRVRVTDDGGSLLYDDDAVPVIGQQVGGGGDVTPVNPDTLAKTGDVKMKFGAGSEAGWVRANGRTLGSATSGATERANADTQPLYEYLWQQAPDSILPVAGGRGVSAAADFSANKQITLPDMRHRAPFGVGGMGNIAVGLIKNDYIDGALPDQVGSIGGDDEIALTEAQLATHHHADGTLAAAAHTHFIAGNNGLTTSPISAANQLADQGRIGDFQAYDLAGSATAATFGKTSSIGSDVTGNTSDTGTGTAHENMPPFMLLSFYIKL